MKQKKCNPVIWGGRGLLAALMPSKGSLVRLRSSYCPLARSGIVRHLLDLSVAVCRFLFFHRRLHQPSDSRRNFYARLPARRHFGPPFRRIHAPRVSGIRGRPRILCGSWGSRDGLQRYANDFDFGDRFWATVKIRKSILKCKNPAPFDSKMGPSDKAKNIPRNGTKYGGGRG